MNILRLHTTRPRRTALRRAVPVLAFCLALAFAATAVHGNEPAVLGADGSILQLRNGTYGELFHDGTEAPAQHRVLALDIVRGDGTQERWLVPETASREPESAEILLFEKSSGSAYLLWEGLYSSIHPQIYMVSFDATGWGEVVEVSSSPFSRKSLLQAVVHRDPASDRTILHLAWWEEAPGYLRKMYTPVVLEEGAYLGWSPLVELASLLPGEVEGESPYIPEELDGLLRIQPSTTFDAVVIGFVHPRTGRLVTIEVADLPTDLDSLSEEARLQIIGIGMRSTSKGEWASEARDKVFGLGESFHIASRNHFADEIQRTIESSQEGLGPEGIASLAEKARLQIIGIGAKIDGTGLEALGEPLVLEVGRSPLGGAPYHLFRATVLSEREIPVVEGAVELFLSASGTEALFVWEEGDTVHYLETAGEGWAEPQRIELGPGLGRELVYGMLERRMLNR